MAGKIRFQGRPVSGKNGISSYRDLLVWQKSMALARKIYFITRSFPAEEKFSLVVQMRRAVVSVPSNIAEGQARQGRREFVHFLSHAEGSLAELDTQLMLAVDLGYCRDIDVQETVAMITELQKMLASLRAKIAVKLSNDH